MCIAAANRVVVDVVDERVVELHMGSIASNNFISTAAAVKNVNMHGRRCHLARRNHRGNHTRGHRGKLRNFWKTNASWNM
jgi:hypothetical protein